ARAAGTGATGKRREHTHGEGDRDETSKRCHRRSPFVRTWLTAARRCRFRGSKVRDDFSKNEVGRVRVRKKSSLTLLPLFAAVGDGADARGRHQAAEPGE